MRLVCVQNLADAFDYARAILPASPHKVTGSGMTVGGQGSAASASQVTSPAGATCKASYNSIVDFVGDLTRLVKSFEKQVQLTEHRYALLLGALSVKD